MRIGQQTLTPPSSAGFGSSNIAFDFPARNSLPTTTRCEIDAITITFESSGVSAARMNSTVSISWTRTNLSSQSRLCILTTRSPKIGHRLS
jgi:hypothetical protein